MSLTTLSALLLLMSSANPFGDAPLKNSIGSFESHQTVVQDLRAWGRENPKSIPLIENGDEAERKKLISLFNDWLKERNLPLINPQGDLKISKTCLIGFVPDPKCFSGFKITDGTHQFCFPCMVGHNLMAIGVVTAKEKLEPVEKNQGAVIELQKPTQKKAPGKK